MECARCKARIEMEIEGGLLHHYQYAPNSVYDSPELFFNVAEARLLASPVVYREDFPYSEGFVELVSSHEFAPNHWLHIPDDSIRPSLVGCVELKRKDGVVEPVTLMLDGHHSAVRRIIKGEPVALQYVPTEVMNQIVKHSLEELKNSRVLVLEGAVR